MKRIDGSRGNTETVTGLTVGGNEKATTVEWNLNLLPLSFTSNLRTSYSSILLSTTAMTFSLEQHLCIKFPANTLPLDNVEILRPLL